MLKCSLFYNNHDVIFFMICLNLSVLFSASVAGLVAYHLTSVGINDCYKKDSVFRISVK